MKKLILFLLPLLALAQNPTNFPYGIKNPAATSDNTPAYFTTTQVDGVHKKTPAALVAKVAIVNDSLATKENVANKSDSYTASSSTTYASTKALVDGLGTKIGGGGGAGFMTKWSSPSSLNTSLMLDNGAVIGVGGIDTNSKFAVSVSSGLTQGVNVFGNMTTATSTGIASSPTFTSTTTSSGRVFSGLFVTQAGSYTLPSVVIFNALQGGVGAGSTVTNLTGFKANSSLVGGVNNFGFTGEIPSSSTSWNLYMSGTAKNYINGTTLVGSTTDNGVDKLQITGTAIANDYKLSTGNVSVGLQTIISSKQGKKIVWFGTSIPGTGYPQLMGTKIGATVYNEALGSSIVRAFSSVTGTQKGLYYGPALRSLGHTIAEKQSMIDHWASGLDSNGVVTGGGTFGWRDLLLGSPPATLSSYASDATILSWSYENKLVDKYLNSASPNYIGDMDYFVFDHGYNDLNTASYDVDTVNAVSIPAVRNDRKYFNGAMNYLIDLILTYNPRAKIIIVGHYENDRTPNVNAAQEIIGDYWNVPTLKIWERLGFSQQIVATTGYWSDSVTWIPSGGTLTNMTLTQIWMQDNLHPFSTPTKERIANVLAQYFTSEIN